MNILLITNSYPNPSKPYAGHHVARHVALHRAAGLSVRVLHPGHSRSGPLSSPLKYLRLALLVWWSAVFHPFDLVHAHWVLPSGLLGVFAAAVRRKPLVVTSHGAFTNTFDRRSPLVRLLVRFVLGRAGRIIAVGREQQRIIEAIAGLPDGAAACVNMGVVIPDTAVSRTQARRRLGLPQDKQLVVFIGNLLQRKGPDILVKAAAQLPEKERLQLYIGGQGPERAALAGQIQALGLDEMIQLIGPVPPEAVYTWLQAADICVVPSRTEPFGLVAVEALACGTPVIAAEVGGLKETVRPNHNGLLFRPGDDQALAACLRQLLDNPDLRQRLSQAAQESAAAYDIRRQADKVLALYEEILK